MKTNILVLLSFFSITTFQAQKSPKGVETYRKELFTKRVKLHTWIKPVLEKNYQWVSTPETADQRRLYAEAYKFLQTYDKTFEDAIFDMSSFCEGTDLHDFDQLQQGIIRFQKLFLVFHLEKDWVMTLEMGMDYNCMVISEWKGENWSEWEEDPLQTQLDLLELMISE